MTILDRRVTLNKRGRSTLVPLIGLTLPRQPV